MDISVFANPIKSGPGMWFKMHTDAITAKDDNLKFAFIINTNATCDNFKCKTCQPHFRNFIDTHPFENYWHIYDDKGRDIGFFKWTWELHNQVNKFLKKYEPTLEEAYEFFSDNSAGACFNCVDNTSVTEKNEQNITTNSVYRQFPPKNSNKVESQNFILSPKISMERSLISRELLPNKHLKKMTSKFLTENHTGIYNKTNREHKPLNFQHPTETSSKNNIYLEHVGDMSINSNKIITSIPDKIINDEIAGNQEQVSRAIPSILTLYRESNGIKPKPFNLISLN